MESSLRKLTFVPTGTTRTCGRKVLFRCVTTLPRAGAGRGVSPPMRFNQRTAPPGPCAPPPETTPLTETLGIVRGGSGVTSAVAAGGGGDASAGGEPGGAATD